MKGGEQLIPSAVCIEICPKLENTIPVAILDERIIVDQHTAPDRRLNGDSAVMQNTRSDAWFRTVIGLFAFCVLSQFAIAADRYGGIEIGAKGVKVSAVEVDGETLKVLSLDKKTVDITISRLKDKKFSEVKIEDVVQVVKGFQAALQTELQIPEDHIQAVASSGVPFAENFGELIEAIQTECQLKLSKIDAREEATLTTLALIPQDWRTRSLVVDIGSGNTKGGAFLNEAGASEDFVVLDAPFGTATLSKAIDEQAQTDGKSRAEVLGTVTSKLVGEPLSQQLSDHPELSERNTILFSGGSVWAAVTIMHPETALDPFPAISVSDLKTYASLLAKTPGEYPEVSFDAISDAAVRSAAEADYDRIRGTSAKAIFTPDELQAGAALLNEVAGTLRFDSKVVYFDRKAVTAWITAKITPEEFRSQLPLALGRRMPPAAPPIAEVPKTDSAVVRFGGIEIGAKGVKVSAIEIEAGKLKVLSLDKKTVDVTISRLKDKKFSDVKIEDVSGVVKDFQSALQAELHIPEGNIQVVASSGVPFTENFGDLVEAIQKQCNAKLSKIEAREEATLTTLALVPKEWRTQTLVIDIGSGNTKGGIFLNEGGAPDDFVVLDAPFGTATLSKAVDEQAQADGKPRANVIRAVTAKRVGEPLRQQLTDHVELSQRKNVLFSGGSVWAAVTIMHPETALDPFPAIRASDLKAYAALLAETPGEYPKVDFDRISDPAVRTAAEGDYDRIRGASAKAVFTPDELQAGAALLNEVAEILDFDKKVVYFDRKAVTAWITARITPVELREQLPNALGRKLPEPVVVSPRPLSPIPPQNTAPVPPVVPANVAPTRLVPPTGLSMPVESLLSELYFLPNDNEGQVVAYTSEFCHNVAVKCYQHGRYQDGLAFAAQSSSLRETPAHLYIRGLCEIAMNLNDDANKTAVKLRKLGGHQSTVIGPLRDRLNGPRTVQLLEMVNQR